MYRTLDDLKKGSVGSLLILFQIDQKDQKKKTSSYTGGEKSGLAVENPEDKQNIMDILNQAQKNSESKKPDDKSEVNCKITLYGNGFIIDGGEFRDYNDPKNKQFVQELKANRVPSELRQKFPNGIQVGLEDRTSEKFEPPPPPPYVQFQGAGVSIGGPAPLQTQQQSKPQQKISQPLTKPSSQQQQHQQQSQQPKVPTTSNQIFHDPKKPSTQILIRLQDGQNVTLTVNLATSVREVYNHVRNFRVNGGTREIKLIAGFPPKQITQLDTTIEAADLMDSQINQSI